MTICSRLCLCFAAALVGSVAAFADTAEVSFAKKDFDKLDAFEGHSLTKADKVFVSKKYRQAAAEYEAFILEFPRSRAIAYALLRKARCKHLDGKRYDALKGYTEVLDYFPDSIHYAAAALYYTGACHWQNGDEEKAMKAWAEMADDEDYCKHYLAADAINKLAGYLEKKDQRSKAIKYFEQVAKDFRDSNQDAANAAIKKVVYYHVRTKPDEAKLREFYAAVRTFYHTPRKLPEDIAGDGTYWNYVRRYVSEYGRFNDVQVAERKAHYKYWADVMEGKFAGWDDFSIDVANFRFQHEEDRAKWFERLDQQFAQHQKEGDIDRIIKWIKLYRSSADKVKEFYHKLDFDKMDNGKLDTLMRVFFDHVQDRDLAQHTFKKFKLNEMTDKHKSDTARYLWHRDPGLGKELCLSMENQDWGKLEILRYHHWKRNTKEGLSLAEELINVPEYAQEVIWIKGEMLEWGKKFKEAIACYQTSERQPDNLFKIADCFAKLGELDRAVSQLREIEGFFKQHASRAALQIATLYKEAQNRPHHVSALRNVLKKYPKSKEASTAHEELEKMGEKIGGGVDAE